VEVIIIKQYQEFPPEGFETWLFQTGTYAFRTTASRDL